MPVSDEFIAEINTAIESTVTEKEEAAKPAPETVVEHEDVVEVLETSEETPGAVVDAATTPDEKPDASTAKSEAPTLSSFAIERAIRAGLDYDTAKSFRTDAELIRITEKIEAAQTPIERETEVVHEDPFAELPVLDPAVYEPEAIAMYDALVKVIRKQQDTIGEFQSQYTQAARVNQEAVARDAEKWFDESVSKLGDEFQDSLGKGEYRSLAQGSPQLIKRDALANQVALLLSGYRATGQQPPSRDEVFSAAAKLVLSKEYETAHEQRLSKELSKRSSQHIARASGKSVKSSDSPQDAVAKMLDEKFFNKT